MLVEGGEEPVVELELHALGAALDFVFLGVIGEVTAGEVERLADAFVPGQFLVELAEQRPRSMNEHRMGHRQHGGDSGGGEARGHAAHRRVGLTVRLLRFAAHGSGLAGGENDESDLVTMEVRAEFVGGDEVGLAVRFLEQEVAGVGRAIRIVGNFRPLVAQDFFQPANARCVRGGNAIGQVAVPVKDAVAVEVEDVHGGFRIVVEPVVQRVERGRAEEFAGDATGGVLVNGIEDGLGIGAWIEEAGIVRAADDEEEVRGILGHRPVSRSSLISTGDAAADADAGLFVKQERAVGSRRVVQQFPRQREDGRVLGGDGEEAGVAFGILELVEAARGFAGFEDGVEERLAPDGKLPLYAHGFLVIRVAERMGAVGFDIPLDVPEVFVRDRIGEG